ncbi:MAG: hypothetical protein B7733_06040 [Myxococcales bacterium FL481]|nr:MAG: hypothetical protein B7733_06040 [Myxococcales bacterium FL481]
MLCPNQGVDLAFAANGQTRLNRIVGVVAPVGIVQNLADVRVELADHRLQLVHRPGGSTIKRRGTEARALEQAIEHQDKACLSSNEEEEEFLGCLPVQSSKRGFVGYCREEPHGGIGAFFSKQGADCVPFGYWLCGSGDEPGAFDPPLQSCAETEYEERSTRRGERPKPGDRTWRCRTM